MAGIDPFRTFRYRLEVDGVTQAGFSEFTVAGKRPDLTKYGNVTLKRGLTVGRAALDLLKWQSDVSNGQITDRRKKVVIVVRDEAGADAARFVVTSALPVKYIPSNLNATANEVVIELLELTNEGVEREA